MIVHNRVFMWFDRGHDRMVMSFGRGGMLNPLGWGRRLVSFDRGGRRRRRCRGDREFARERSDQTAQRIDLRLIGIQAPNLFGLSFQGFIATELDLLPCPRDVGRC